jgi:Holliday junction resolvase
MRGALEILFLQQRRTKMTLKREAPSARGARFEIVIAADLMRQGWTVFRSLSPIGKTDLIALKQNALIKIQCRSTLNSWQQAFNGNDILAVVDASGGPVRYFAKRRSQAVRLFETCEVLTKRKKTGVA